MVVGVVLPSGEVGLISLSALGSAQVFAGAVSDSQFHAQRPLGTDCRLSSRLSEISQPSNDTYGALATCPSQAAYLNESHAHRGRRARSLRELGRRSSNVVAPELLVFMPGDGSARRRASETF